MSIKSNTRFAGGCPEGIDCNGLRPGPIIVEGNGKPPWVDRALELTGNVLVGAMRVGAQVESLRNQLPVRLGGGMR
jgi:hypothetical protein